VNIFAVDNHPEISAQQLCNKHVVKMTLETAQLLSSIFPNQGLYKPTHLKHPCTLWAKASIHNSYWLYLHGVALAKEYSARYHKTHKSLDVIYRAGQFIKNADWRLHTPFALAMPDKYKQSDPVLSYRAYYCGEKAAIAEWPIGKIPHWFTGDLNV